MANFFHAYYPYQVNEEGRWNQAFPLKPVKTFEIRSERWKIRDLGLGAVVVFREFEPSGIVTIVP